MIDILLRECKDFFYFFNKGFYMRSLIVFLCGFATLFSQERVYILGLSNSLLRVFDFATNAVIATVSTPGSIRNLAVSLDGTKTYVTSSESPEAIYVINNLTNLVIATIPGDVSNDFDGVAISPDGTQVYVTDSLSSSVIVIDTATNTIVKTISVGNGPRDVVFAPDGTKAYVVNQVSTTISVIDTASQTVETINLSIATPSSLVISPDGRTLYALGTSELSVFDTVTNTETIVFAGSSPSDLAITPDGSRLYIAATNIKVLDTATNMITQEISVGGSPTAVAITFDGGQVYVARFFNSNITVIDTSTNEVTGTFPVGFAVSELAFGEFLAATAEPKTNVALTQKELFNEVTWTRSNQVAAVNYYIYRSAGFNDLIGVVPSTELTFKDHNKSKGEINSYFIAAEDQFGNQFLIGTTSSVEN